MQITKEAQVFTMILHSVHCVLTFGCDNIAVMKMIADSFDQNLR